MYADSPAAAVRTQVARRARALSETRVYKMCSGLQADNGHLRAQLATTTAAVEEKGRLLEVKEDGLLFARAQALRLEEQLHLASADRCDSFFLARPGQRRRPHRR